MRWAGNVARMGDRRGAYKVLVKNPKGQKPLWRSRRRWDENMRTYLLDGTGLIRIRRRAFVYTVMNCRFA